MNKYDIKTLVDNPCPLLLDIGCYNGKDSKEMADIVGGIVHCFEPDPLSATLFRKTFEEDHRLILHETAIGNTIGEITFYQSDHPQSNSIRQPKEHLELFPNVVFDEKTTVKCTTLDAWYQQFIPGETIDFIWADVNGAEKDLIEGGRETLISHTRYLYIEVSKKELYEGQQHYSFLEKLLPEFKAQCMYNWGDNFGNVLLKNRNL